MSEVSLYLTSNVDGCVSRTRSELEGLVTSCFDLKTRDVDLRKLTSGLLLLMRPGDVLGC